MKKQNNEGFALAYVMIVVTVLNLIAVALMSMSFRVFQAEQASIQRMQAKYAAQGEIERLVVEITNLESMTGEGHIGAAKSAFETGISKFETLTATDSEDLDFTFNKFIGHFSGEDVEQEGKSLSSYILVVSSQKTYKVGESVSTVSVDTTIQINLDINVKDVTPYESDVDGNPITSVAKKYEYTTTIRSVEFNDYNISNA